MRAAFTALVIAIPLVAIAGPQHAANVARVTLMRGPVVAIDDFAARTSSSVSGELKLEPPIEAYWHYTINGSTTYFFYAGPHTLVFECRVTNNADNGKKVTSRRQVIKKYLTGGEAYSALATIGLRDGSCAVQIKKIDDTNAP